MMIYMVRYSSTTEALCIIQLDIGWKDAISDRFTGFSDPDLKSFRHIIHVGVNPVNKTYIVRCPFINANFSLNRSRVFLRSGLN
jgi:hypothetical protein